MAIIINIDVMLAKRKMSVTELADKVGITMANISILKNGKAKAIRLSTLEAVCKALECQPGDILEYSHSNSCGAKREQAIVEPPNQRIELT
jgi:putative transcriptional regulator